MQTIEYEKRDGPVTAHEVLALDFLAYNDALPANPLTPEQLKEALRSLPPVARDLLREQLAGSFDEGAGIIQLLTDD